MSDAGAYQPIEDYGAIGNLRTVALAGRDGSIDWCCLPDLDSPSTFGALLDARRGGRFRVAPAGGGRGEQRYLPRSNVLETRFQCGGGALELTDFMPLADSIIGSGGAPVPVEILRRVRCTGEPVTVEVAWSPRFDYARARPRLARQDGAWLASAADARLTLAGLDGGELVEDREGAELRASVTLEPGRTLALVCRWGDDVPDDVGSYLGKRLGETLQAWHEWAHQCAAAGACAFEGEFHDVALRSGLALKLLTHPQTGAIAAAATTSLPEQLGGVRNWDYRFTWVRDAALTAQALVSLGHRSEALGFLRFLQRTAQETVRAGRPLQIMFGLHGETELEERELSHLAGYRGSRPVRVGNAAARQRQLDVLGELLSSAQEFVRHGGTLPPGIWSFLELVVEQAAESWQEPDHGIWEMRTEPRHFTHSKVMAWVALDRGIALARRFGDDARVAHWQAVRHRIRAAILQHGYDAKLGAFVQSFGSPALDAANLLIPIVGFLPFDDPRVQGTIDRTLEQLTSNGLVYRYLAGDGLPGGDEGAFGLTTCWAVAALALSGRREEAQALLGRVRGLANHLGLYAEEFVPSSGSFLGNFPQAFTHVGVINSALYLARSQGRSPRAAAPMGSRAHRLESGHDPGAAA